MANVDDFDGLQEWLESKLGYELACMREGEVPVLSNIRDDDEPLLAYKIGERSVMRVKANWVDAITSIVKGLALDELFSIFGCYELARMTLGDNVSMWGPSLYYFADETCFISESRNDVVQLAACEIEGMDNLDVFWHCDWRDGVTNFGMLDGNRLIALASVRDFGARVYEIGVDVAPGNGQRGLGQAVVGAAGQWILEQGRLILATTAQWNVPSARLQRSLGMQYVLCDLTGRQGPFRVAPQPLGKPLPDATIYNLYPDWAMNSEIRKRDEIA